MCLHLLTGVFMDCFCTFITFFVFVGESSQKDIHSMEEFLGSCSGKSFLNGLYRIHYTADIPKWNDIVGKAFPK